jgi:hypothetical protein
MNWTFPGLTVAAVEVPAYRRDQLSGVYLTIADRPGDTP